MLSEQEAQRTKKMDDVELMHDANSMDVAGGVDANSRLARVVIGLTIVVVLAGFLLVVGLWPIMSSRSPISLPETAVDSPALS
jgi:hypothetical protein